MRPGKAKGRVFAGILLLLVAGCVTVKVSLFEEPRPLKEKVVSGTGRDKILLMDISGIIVEIPPPWALEHV